MALTFFWRCEGETLDGTHDYSAGDTTATSVSGAELNTGAVKIGTNGFDSVDGTAYYDFAISSGDLAAVAEGSAAFWYYPEATWQVTQEIWNIFASGSPNDEYLILKSGSSGSGGLTFRTRSAGAGEADAATGDIGMTNGNWYFVVVSWDEANTSTKIQVYDSTLTDISSGGTENTSVSATKFPDTAPDTFRIGHVLGGSESGFFDNIFLADAYDEDLVSNANITSYTLYGGGGGISIPIVHRHHQLMKG